MSGKTKRRGHGSCGCFHAFFFFIGAFFVWFVAFFGCVWVIFSFVVSVDVFCWVICVAFSSAYLLFAEVLRILLDRLAGLQGFFVGGALSACVQDRRENPGELSEHNCRLWLLPLDLVGWLFHFFSRRRTYGGTRERVCVCVCLFVCFVVDSFCCRSERALITF